MSGPQSAVRVLVSYTQETAAHQVRCRELADRLREDGIEAWIDQYVPAPSEGWPRWMQQQIITSTFVILVCTPTFRRRFEGTETRGNGHGATWEGLIATQLLYDNGSRNEKLVPVLFEDATIEAVPTVLRPFTRYSMLAEYDGLLRHLTAQPAIVPPPVGALKVMPPLARTTRAPQTPSVAVPASGGVDIIPPVLREAPTQHPARASEDYSMGISRRNISGTVDLIRGPNFFAAKLPCWQTLRDETLKKTAISPADLRVVSRGNHTTDEFVLRRLCLQLSESYPDDVFVMGVSELLDGESERAQRARSVLLEFLESAKLINLNKNLHVGALYDLAGASSRYGALVRSAVDEALSKVIRL